MNVAYFEKSVVFQQKVKLTGKTAIVKGSLEFMVCDDTPCLPPKPSISLFLVISNEGVR